jgi:aspartyl-tRNA(Asn)/glutamyl-tRNA(Gln) amidotransferase subunit B
VTEWQTVVGIEIHVELATKSKMFCGCVVNFDSPPNTNVCMVCLGMPGALPVPNETALEWITQIGLALNCSITENTQFARKNYFYADQPKNYQITQAEGPVCVDGFLDIQVEGEEPHRVIIERAHMEEDTGKSTHVGSTGRIDSAEETWMDFNRAGTPLVEIVTTPSIETGPQARAYAQKIRELVMALGVSDVKLEEGSMRFDSNISVNKPGEPLGTKVEVKNMNSFRSLERATDFEIARQIAAIEAGERIVQETRHWDEEKQTSKSMRSKEGSSDYRYFIEPDMVPMVLDAEWVARAQAALPELPDAQQARYEALGLDQQAASVIVGLESAYSSILEAAIGAGADARLVSNWLTQDVTAWARSEERTLDSTPLTGSALAELSAMVSDGKLSATAAKKTLAAVLEGQGSPEEVAVAMDLLQMNDLGAIEAVVDQLIADNPDDFERLVGGDGRVNGFFVGQAMRATGGKADPKIVNQILRDRADR